MIHHIPENLTETLRHEILASEMRRCVIEIFGVTHGPIESTLGELANDIDRYYSGTGNWSSQTILVRLHHVHLPLLDDAGLIDYDEETKQVSLRAAAAMAQLARTIPEAR